MDMGEELKQNYDMQNQVYFLTPNIDSKDEFPFTFHTTNTQKSTCEKEPESEPNFAYNQNRNGSQINSQAFNLYSSDTSRSHLHSGIFLSNRDSNVGIEDQKKGVDQFNRFLDFSQQEVYDNQKKKSRNNTIINHNDQRRNTPNIQIISESQYNQNIFSQFNQNVPIQTLEYNNQKSNNMESSNGSSNGNNSKYVKKNSDKIEMMMILDVVDEDENLEGNNRFDKDIENGSLFNAPITPQQQLQTSGNYGNSSKNSSFVSSSYNKNNSIIEQSTRPFNESNRMKTLSISKGAQTINYDTEEIECHDKQIEDKIANNTQKSYLHKKRIKENLIELQAINEQQYADDKSHADSWKTKNSYTEEKILCPCNYY